MGYSFWLAARDLLYIYVTPVVEHWLDQDMPTQSYMTKLHPTILFDITITIEREREREIERERDREGESEREKERERKIGKKEKEKERKRVRETTTTTTIDYFTIYIHFPPVLCSICPITIYYLYMHNFHW